MFLGGSQALADFNYMGHDILIDIHGAHRRHVQSFLLQEDKGDKTLHIGFCGYHGAGNVAVPRLLREMGFDKLKMVHQNGLAELNGLFPSFNSEAGKEQQPDPGDPRAARIAVKSFKEEYPDAWEDLDIMIGTDPDADRCGVTVKVPENQRSLYNGRDYVLVPADDMWSLLIWYRLQFDKSINKEEAFIVLSHTTTDALVKIAQKYGVGVIKTWVGFAALSAAIRDAWEGKLVGGLSEGKKQAEDELCDMFVNETYGMDTGKRSYNLGALEQSNGFSILGYPPEDQFSLGKDGHVRDKDGTFAAILVTEIAEWAKQHGTTLFELIDKHIYLDPDIGLFVNHYEPDPLDGEYPGIEGDRIKKSILRRALGLYQYAKAGGLKLGGLPVHSAVIYRTGKYDHVYPPTLDYRFPDEGLRFYFHADRLSHLTIRPSGTGNALRFHIQLHSDVDETNLVAKKQELHDKAKAVANDIRRKLGAPRTSELV